MNWYFRVTSAIWLVLLLGWPITWSLQDFSDSYHGGSITMLIVVEYITWSALLYPLYAAVAVIGGYKLYKVQAPAGLCIMASLVPLFSSTPYVVLSLLIALAA